MGRVLTNNTGLNYTVETALGVAGTTWFELEPNAIGAFGSDITTEERSPISKNRQRRKGTVTDLDSTVEFDADLTVSAFRDFLAGFVFVTGINSDVTEMAATAAETTGDSYTGMTALSAAQADKMEISTLIWVSGGETAANNGLKEVDADIATSATAITVAENLVDETAAFKISIAGYRIPTASSPTWDWDAPATDQATLNLTGITAVLQALGVIPGWSIHIGSVSAVGGTTVAQAFENAAADDMFGWVRVVSFPDADSVVFDKVDAALQFDDAVAPVTAVDLIFGEFFRNVAVDHAEFLEESFQFEGAYPNLGDGTVGNTDESFEYAKGNYCDALSFDLPLTNKAAITFGFIGTDTDVPTTTRKSGASAATAPLKTGAFNTSSDIARLRITEVDETGLTTDFKSLKFTIGNNVGGEKVLAQLGAKYINIGNFDIDIEAELLFTNPLVVDAIRNNTTLTMDFNVSNDDGTIHVDIPSMTLGGGEKDYPVNESIKINVEAKAFGDATLDTSVGISVSPVPIPATGI